MKYGHLKPSKGLCRICGKSNKLPIHQHCGRRSAPVRRRYTEAQISAILKGVDN